MRNFFLLIALFITTSTFSQEEEDTLFMLPSENSRLNAIGGLSAYYFWEEDSLGFIVDSTFDKVFKCNYNIALQDPVFSFDRTDYLKKAVYLFSEDVSKSEEKSRFWVKDKEDKQKVIIPLRRSSGNIPSSVIYRSQNGVCRTDVYKNVLYINVYSNLTRKFSHANDSLILNTLGMNQKAFGHYLVKRFWNDSGALVLEQVYAFNGDNVTEYFTSQQKPEPQHLIVFSSGYRGPKKNRDVTDNLITKKDRFHYWLRLDKAFINRIKPDDYFYIDGNSSIRTSNHRSMANFSLSYSRVKSLRKKDRNRYDYHLLNTTPNDSGFYYRKTQGVLAAQAYLTLKCNSPACHEVKDTIDIVCHSMGYSYSLGFIETVKDYVVFRNMYIIAPENARAGGADWSMFREVWQYGSNMDEANPAPVWEQDGIAPQTAVKGIHEVVTGGRVFFPEDSKRLNFINSHMLNHYRWIFTKLKAGDRGYVY
ncbi:MAG: hypothetical protein K0R65_2062 [Crocinitomicaceae bacterium]|jgi:hypothetical protein|nr:hypothetical protein [Crocinitomicaceae bacterium]